MNRSPFHTLFNVPPGSDLAGCQFVCVCVKFTECYQDLCKSLQNGRQQQHAFCLRQRRSMHVPGSSAVLCCGSPQMAANSIYPTVASIQLPHFESCLNIQASFFLFYDQWSMIYIFFLWGIQVDYIVHEFHFKLLTGSLVSNLIVSHCSKPTVMIPSSFTKHSPLFAARGGQGQGTL